MIPWPIRFKRAPTSEVGEPAPALAEGICGACSARIRKVKGNIIPSYWVTIDPLAPNVALPMECGKNPRRGMGPGSFNQHYPR